ncbi:MAG: tetratricopeptide repeat protein [Candidatus Cyclobacteriaceae bacterium M3_2C_046]
MLIKRVVLVIIAVGLIIFLYTLPRVVVNDDSMTDSEDGSETEVASTTPSSIELNEAEQSELINLRENFLSSTNNEKSAIFADSLAELYQNLGVYDSAAWYYTWLAENSGSEKLEYFLQAGNMYYLLFEQAQNAENAQAYAKKAQAFYEDILLQQPARADVKNKLAMTYIVSSNPMTGVMMLREIVEQDPDNQEALFNLGVLSIQSSQYDRAVERLERLIELNPDHIQAHFYLGMSYFELGQTEEARTQFEMVKNLDADPEIQAAVDNYLDQLGRN